MKFVSMAGAALAAWLGSSAAAAPLDYDCDTAAGSYSMIDLVQPGPGYRIRGTVTGVQFRKDDRWLPTATIALVSADKSNFVSVQLMRQARDSKMELAANGLLRGERRSAEGGRVGLGEAVPFEITSGGGRTVVQFGDKRTIFDFDLGADSRVQVSCSTGQFRFEGLDWEAPAR